MASNILVRASKAPEKSLVEVEVDVGATVKDVAVALGNKLGTDASVIVVICRGAVLKDLGAPLRAAAAAGFGEDGVLSIVFMARGPKAAVAPNSAPVPKAAPAAAAPAETAAFKSGTTKETDSVESIGRALDANVERVISQVAAGHHSHTESDDEMINVELQLVSGPTWITVTRDEKVYDAVADRLQCKPHQLKRIDFAGVPLSRTENLTFEDIDIDDGGRLGVDYSVAVRLIPSSVCHRLVLLTVGLLF